MKKLKAEVGGGGMKGNKEKGEGSGEGNFGREGKEHRKGGCAIKSRTSGGGGFRNAKKWT